MEEQQNIRKNFFFSKPHMRMFRTDPFDDAEMRLEMGEPQSEIDQVQQELERSTKNFKDREYDI
jgi:hypothetical protein